MRHTLTVFALLPLLAGTVLGDDWPQWRGPEGIGVSRETDLPTQWSAKQGVAWRAPLPGLGTSSPIVWGDRVFLTSQLGAAPIASSGSEFEGASPARPSSETKEASFVVQAFHRADGRLLWEHRLARVGTTPELHRKHNLASPSVATDGQAVFAWFGTGQLVALGLDGDLRWKRHLGQDYAPYDIRWGHGSSPVLYDDLLLLLCDHQPGGYLLALDKDTGKERWKLERGEGARSYSTPLVIRRDGDDRLIVNSNRRIEALDPATGALRWHAGEENRVPVGMPVVGDGVLYSSRGYASGPYMAIRLGGRGNVSETHVSWRVPTGAPYVSSLLYYEGLLYMATEKGIASAVDPATGERLWRKRLGGVFSASPVGGDSRVYFLAESGDTFVFKAGPEGDLVAQNSLGERTLASPAFSGGHIFIRTDRHLVKITR